MDLAKASPGELNYGSAGMGSPQHLHAEFFNQLAGLKTTHIPYKGQSQAMTDLLGGQLQYMFSPLQNALPNIQQGRLRVLALARRPHAQLPAPDASLDEIESGLCLIGLIGLIGTERFDSNVHDLGSTTVKGPVAALYGN